MWHSAKAWQGRSALTLGADKGLSLPGDFPRQPVSSLLLVLIWRGPKLQRLVLYNLAGCDVRALLELGCHSLR